MSGSTANLAPAPNRQKLSKYCLRDSKNGNYEFPNNPKDSDLLPTGIYCQNLAAISLPGPVGRK
jgi:hypothetical protein